MRKKSPPNPVAKAPGAIGKTLIASHGFSPAAVLLAAMLAGNSAGASTIGWTGTTDTTWATGTNWTGGTAPANNLTTDIALFNLTLYPNQPNAGTTSVNGIQIGDGTTSTAALTIGGTALTLGSGGITMNANAGAATITAPITLGAAQTWTNNSSSLLTVDTISRATGMAVTFSPGTGGIKTSNTNTNGILGGWATVGTATGSGATADWATVDGSGNVSAYTGYTTVSTGSATSITLDGTQAALNYKAGNSPTLVGTAYTTTWSTSGGGIGTINSLAVVNDNSVSSGSTLSLGSGGLILEGISRWILNNGSGSTAGTGQLTSGLGTGELFVNVVSSASDANNWRIWTKIVDNGGTAVSLVKNGAGDLGLLNSNSYTGGTYLNSGTLSIASSGSLGTGDLRMNGGTLNIRYAGANVDLANNLVISGSNNIYLGVAKNLGLNGTISGSGTLTLGNDGQNSTIYLSGANTMTSGTITLANNTNSVRFANASAGNANVAWVVNNTGANKNTLDFTTGTISFGSLSGSGLLQANNATGTKVISVGGLNTNSTFSGAIGGGSGTIAVTKVGSGTWTLSGANTYTGATTVNAGTLALGAANRIADTSALVMNGGTFATGGFSETLGVLTLSSNSILDFGSGNSALVFADSSGATWSGTLTLTNFNIGTDTLKFGTSVSALSLAQLNEISLAGYTASLDSSGFVTFSAIPEPSTYAVLLGVASFGGMLVRRRFAKKA